MNLAPSNENTRPADDNVVQSFQIEKIEGSNTALRGRVVRLGAVLDDILEPHNYPLPVAHLVAETITLALLLSSMLKYEGIFNLQIKGDGPVSMLLADVTSEGVVRGCASFDDERLEHSRAQIKALRTKESSENHLAQYLGKGYIAFTVYKAGKEVGYQGIVDLQGASLADCVRHYFTQSEQIGTAIKMAVGRRGDQWRAGGIMLQDMPDNAANIKAGIKNLGEDEWRHAMILMQTCTEEEFLDPALHSNTLLQRIFSEEEVRVFLPFPVQKGCRCSAEKTESMLHLMSKEDIDYIAENGAIEMRCEFCSKIYHFDAKDFDKKF